jgi:hypothetical protein
MSRDVIVRWDKERPSHEELKTVLEDYLGALAESVVRTQDRICATLLGPLSFAFQRIGPATEAMRKVWKEEVDCAEPRMVEVWVSKNCMYVMTRRTDHVTNVIADGFAALCARSWNGRLVS